jgi:four helix bundle protein
VINLADSLPSSMAGMTIGNQIIRPAASADANCRAAQRGRSKAEFTAKLSICLEEINECCHRPELVFESGMLAETTLKPLHTKAHG